MAIKVREVKQGPLGRAPGSNLPGLQRPPQSVSANFRRVRVIDGRPYQLNGLGELVSMLESV